MTLDGIGQVDLSLDIDSDEYANWLSDNELTDSRESLMRYIGEQADIDVEYFDNETYHTCGYDSCSISELEDCVGTKMCSELLDKLIENGSASFETCDVYNSTDFDVNNPNELNDIAMKLLNHGGYFKGCRGFILTNGVIVYTPMEHNEVSRINGIKGTYDFLRKGNIRLLDRSIDIALKPTQEQRNVLRQVIASYSDGDLYLDLFTENNYIGVQYHEANYQYVLGEIDRWFAQGIKPQGNLYENKSKTMKKRIRLTESELKKVIYEAIQRTFSGVRDFEMPTRISVEFPDNLIPDDEVYDDMYLGDDINVTITFTYTPGQNQTYDHEGLPAKFDIKNVKVEPNEVTNRNLTPEMVDYIENDMIDVLNNDSNLKEQMERYIEDDDNPSDLDDNIDDKIGMYEGCESGVPRRKRIGIRESSDAFNAYKIFRDCGWAFFEATDVVSKSTGAKGTRYTLEKDSKNPCSLDALKAKLEAAFGKGKVIVSTTQYRYAPEIIHPSVIILNKGTNRKL